jgi:hypothetical protein
MSKHAQGYGSLLALAAGSAVDWTAEAMIIT